MGDKARLEALAKMIDAQLRGAPEKPKLRLVARADLARAVPQGIDHVTREAQLRRIRHLATMYHLGWLVHQEAMHVGGADNLEPEDLSALLVKMERARECRVEGIAFDDAGLVRPGTESCANYG